MAGFYSSWRIPHKLKYWQLQMCLLAGRVTQTDPESTQLAADPNPDRPQGLGGAVPAVAAVCMQASQDGSGGISNSQTEEAWAYLRAVTL